MSYTFSATGLPPGLSLVGSQILGTPSAPGNYTVIVTVSDGVSSVSETVSLSIGAVPVPLPFWQLILSAASGCYAGDRALILQTLSAETGTYWQDAAAIQPAIAVDSGAYWQDEAKAAIAEAGSYARDSVAIRPTIKIQTGSYWRDTAAPRPIVFVDSGSYSRDSVAIDLPSTFPSAYWNLLHNGNAAVGSTNFAVGEGITFASGAYAASSGASNGTLIAADSSDIAIGNAAFTWGCWIYFNTTSGFPFFLSKGFVPGVNYPLANFEWTLYYSSSDDRFKLSWYTANVGGGDPQTVLTASTFGAAAAGNWYYVVFYHNPGSTSNELGISINNGAFDTLSTTINHADSGQNLTAFHRSQDGQYTNGRMRYIGFWKDLPLVLGGSLDLAYYYNSGAGRSL